MPVHRHFTQIALSKFFNFFGSSNFQEVWLVIDDESEDDKDDKIIIIAIVIMIIMLRMMMRMLIK